MTTDLVVLPIVQTPALMPIDRVDPDILERILAEEEQRGGMFPGEIITFKKGMWFMGFGKEAPRWDERSRSLILNLPNMWFGWQMFDEGKPVFGPIARPAFGEKLVERKTLGHTEKELWEINPLNNKPKDPWGRYAAIPFRYDGDNSHKINTLFLGNWSSVEKVRGLLKTYAKEVRNHHGMLPVVNLGADIERHWDDDSITFHIPTFEIADWEKPVAADVGGENTTTTTEDSHPEVKVIQRNSATAATVEKIKTEATSTSFADTMNKLDEESAKERAAQPAAPEAPKKTMNGQTTTGGRRRQSPVETLRRSAATG